jgi:NADH-quinone oxidoreductase subunit L
MMFLTFYGENRAGTVGHGHGHGHGHDDHHHEPHESPTIMLIPLGVLALGAMFSGMIWYNVFFGKEEAVRDWFGMEAAQAHGEAHAEPLAAATADAAPEASAAEPAHHAAVAPKGAIFIGPENTVLHDAHYVPKWVKVSPFVAMVLGLALSWLFYIKNPSLPGRLAANQRPLYLFLLNKWYFDELYDWIFVRPAKWLGGFLWKKGDGSVIDGSINGVAMGIIPMLTRLAGRAQSGYVFHYAFAMVLGIVALITWVTLFGAH